MNCKEVVPSTESDRNVLKLDPCDGFTINLLSKINK
jgi:hypothetical protein